MILGIGFLLTVSLVLSGAISALGKYFFADMEAVLQVANFVVSFGVITLLFAMIYKILPNIQIEWKDVWVGAAITALLFALGKSLIGLYIGKSSVSTSFGGAGPFVVMMVWIYYSTQIFLSAPNSPSMRVRQSLKAPASRALLASFRTPLHLPLRTLHQRGPPPRLLHTRDAPCCEVQLSPGCCVGSEL